MDNKLKIQDKGPGCSITITLIMTFVSNTFVLIEKSLKQFASGFFLCIISNNLTSQERFERPTDALEGRCSIQLSYWDMAFLLLKISHPLSDVWFSTERQF